MVDHKYPSSRWQNSNRFFPPVFKASAPHRHPRSAMRVVLCSRSDHRHYLVEFRPILQPNGKRQRPLKPGNAYSRPDCWRKHRERSNNKQNRTRCCLPTRTTTMTPEKKIASPPFISTFICTRDRGAAQGMAAAQAPKATTGID